MTSTLETLRNVTTGTITTMLLKKGIRHSWMAGVKLPGLYPPNDENKKCYEEWKKSR